MHKSVLSQCKDIVLPIEIPIKKVRWSHNRLMFIMEVPILLPRKIDFILTQGPVISFHFAVLQEDPNACLPRIIASLFMSPGGDKFYQLLLAFSRYVLCQLMGPEPGQSPWTRLPMIDKLIKQVLFRIAFTMEQPYMLPILQWQFHACWCTGDFRSQCISRHGINPQSRNIPFAASEELRDLIRSQICASHMQSVDLIRSVFFTCFCGLSVMKLDEMGLSQRGKLGASCGKW